MMTRDLEKMCIVAQGANHKSAPIPQEGRWVRVTEIKDISGFAHGCGTCAPQMGTCKLTLNIKEGIVQEALIEHIGCSGMSHSAAMASEILPGKTILEAMNTDLVCDATNSALKALFLQIVYGRTQTSYSDGGLPIGAAWEDLGAGVRSQTGTSYGTTARGPRYLETTEGYITKLGLDENNEIIGYEFINIGKMMEYIADGLETDAALKKARGQYGRYFESVRQINPRRE